MVTTRAKNVKEDAKSVQEAPLLVLGAARLPEQNRDTTFQKFTAVGNWNCCAPFGRIAQVAWFSRRRR